MGSRVFGWQEPARGRERVCRRSGQFGGFPRLSSAASGLFQGHLGFPVLPGHRQLPVLLTEGTTPQNIPTDALVIAIMTL